MPNSKKPADKKRRNIVKIAFTDQEFEEQFRLAKLTGMPMAVYCRLKILSRSVAIAPAINQQVWAQLSATSNDLLIIKELLILAQKKNSRVPDRLLELLETELMDFSHLKDSLWSQTDEQGKGAA